MSPEQALHWNIAGTTFESVQDMHPDRREATMVYKVAPHGGSESFLPNVVLKCIDNNTKSSQRRQMAERALKREIKALQTLADVELVTKMIDHGDLEDGGAYILLELIEGQNLKDVLVCEKHLNIKHVVAICADLCKTLTEIHQQNILHLDIKPSNILIDYRRFKAVIIDFNVALSDFQTKTDTRAPQRLDLGGTLPYAAPEQFRNKTRNSGSYLSERSDIHALAATVYEMITGKRLFEHVGASIEERRNPSESGIQQNLERFLQPSSSQQMTQLFYESIRSSPDRRPETTEVFFDRFMKALA
jgi:serine/threonine protein kinase